MEPGGWKLPQVHRAAVDGCVTRVERKQVLLLLVRRYGINNETIANNIRPLQHCTTVVGRDLQTMRRVMHTFSSANSYTQATRFPGATLNNRFWTSGTSARHATPTSISVFQLRMFCFISNF